MAFTNPHIILMALAMLVLAIATLITALKRQHPKLTTPLSDTELMLVWQRRYADSLLELRKVNKGAQRLRRKLDVAKSKLRRAGRPLEEREPPHCPSCSCGLAEHPGAESAASPDTNSLTRI